MEFQLCWMYRLLSAELLRHNCVSSVQANREAPFYDCVPIVSHFVFFPDFSVPKLLHVYKIV